MVDEPQQDDRRIEFLGGDPEYHFVTGFLAEQPETMFFLDFAQEQPGVEDARSVRGIARLVMSPVVVDDLIARLSALRAAKP